MLLTNLGILLLTITCTKADMWKFPTATDVQTSLEKCQFGNQTFPFANQKTYVSGGDGVIRCFTRALGLWSDSEGFRAKRFVKLLKKYHQAIEILVVIDYCNTLHKQTDLERWAYESFNCFAQGHMGPWIKEFIKNLYKKDITY